MPYYLLLAFGGLWAILFLRFNRRWLYQVAYHSLAVLDTMLSTKSDEEKLEILPKATGRLILSLGLSIVLIALAFGIAYLPFGGSEFLFGPAPPKPAWAQITALSLGASVPFFLPLRRGASNYSELSILLHRLVLNHYALGKKLLKRELKRKTKKGLERRPDFLIISGLARAGTTSMMNHIAKRKEFSSLSYANMPFLLAPNLWAKIYRPKSGNEKERSHQDGIKIGLSSYEALEEYYHKTEAEDQYIEEKTLREYRLSAEAHDRYLDYQKLIRQSPEQIYLAKNNNFLLRYSSLREHNPQFTMVILFREPLLHAASLLEKHHQYCALQQEDPFVLEYMNWLGHHEFGLGHKVFSFDRQTPPIGEPEELDYWLKVWLNYYQKALSIEDDKTLFIAYEDFCREPQKCLDKIYRNMDLKPKPEQIPSFANNRELGHPNCSEALLAEAEALYQKLMTKV